MAARLDTRDALACAPRRGRQECRRIGGDSRRARYQSGETSPSGHAVFYSLILRKEWHRFLERKRRVQDPPFLHKDSAHSRIAGMSARRMNNTLLLSGPIFRNRKFTKFFRGEKQRRPSGYRLIGPEIMPTKLRHIQRISRQKPQLFKIVTPPTDAGVRLARTSRYKID